MKAISGFVNFKGHVSYPMYVHIPAADSPLCYYVCFRQKIQVGFLDVFRKTVF